MDIVESLAFLQYLYELTNLSSWHLNCQNWSYKRSYLLEIYIIIILLCSSSIMFYSFLTENDFIKTNVNEIGQTVDFIQMIGIRLAHIISITEALYMKHEQKKFYEHVRDIDQMFHCKLNVEINNRKFRQWIMQRGIIMFLIYLGADLTMLTTKIITKKYDFFLFWLFYIMPMLICGLRYFQMFTSIMIVQQRLKELIRVLNGINLLKPMTTVEASNHKIETLSENTTMSSATSSLSVACNNMKKKKKMDQTIMPMTIHLTNHNNYLKSQIQSVSELKTESPLTQLNCQMLSSSTHQINEHELEIEKLLIARDLYNRLYKLTKIINRYFGLSMLINVGNDFISITSNCYWIFINFKQYSSTTSEFLQTICSAAWSVPHLLNILILATICERTVHCTTDLALILHCMDYDYTNNRYNSIITQFSLQLLHQKISLTAAGFFNIDCTVLYTIAGATTTYLIILIQFHLNESKPIT